MKDRSARHKGPARLSPGAGGCLTPKGGPCLVSRCALQAPGMEGGRRPGRRSAPLQPLPRQCAVAHTGPARSTSRHQGASRKSLRRASASTGSTEPHHAMGKCQR